MKILLSLITLFSFSGCFGEKDIKGVWNLELNLQNNKLPFYMEFSDSKVILQNNTELIELNYLKEKDMIIIPILNYDAALELKQLGNTLRGHWIKYNRTPEYKISVFGMKTNRDKLPDVPKPYFTESINMKITIDKKDSSILTHSPPNLHSSIVTETGDYRYLTSKVINDEVIFYGFDGLFAFFIKGKMMGEFYEGKLFSGLSYNKNFKGIHDPSFKLRDPDKITTYQGKFKDLILPSIDGNEYKILSDSKLTIVQIFGSWCPNCIDETKFILDWKKKNPNKKVDFKIVSFERSPNKKHAIKMLKKTKKLLGIDYPILIGGYSKEDKVDKVFPGMKDFISFPTTLYIDSNNKVIKIHAGFNGPATGEFYENFIFDFNNFINKVLNE